MDFLILNLLLVYIVVIIILIGVLVWLTGYSAMMMLEAVIEWLSKKSAIKNAEKGENVKTKNQNDKENSWQKEILKERQGLLKHIQNVYLKEIKSVYQVHQFVHVRH